MRMKVVIGHKRSKTLLDYVTEFEDVIDITRTETYVVFRAGKKTWTYPWAAVNSFYVEEREG